jgi:hypothetical protein
MKPRKGKTISKVHGNVCISVTNTTDTELRVVSHPGLRRQDARSGGQMEQVKSVLSSQTHRRETSANRGMVCPGIGARDWVSIGQGFASVFLSDEPFVIGWVLTLQLKIAE